MKIAQLISDAQKDSEIGEACNYAYLAMLNLPASRRRWDTIPLCNYNNYQRTQFLWVAMVTDASTGKEVKSTRLLAMNMIWVKQMDWQILLQLEDVSYLNRGFICIYILSQCTFVPFQSFFFPLYTFFILNWNQRGLIKEAVLPHKVKMQYLHFRLHTEYFLLSWKIPEVISRRSIFFHN